MPCVCVLGGGGGGGLHFNYPSNECLIFLQPEWSIADPICTFLFSVLVLLTTINILLDALHILCEGKLN